MNDCKKVLSKSLCVGYYNYKVLAGIDKDIVIIYSWSWLIPRPSSGNISYTIYITLVQHFFHLGR